MSPCTYNLPPFLLLVIHIQLNSPLLGKFAFVRRIIDQDSKSTPVLEVCGIYVPFLSLNIRYVDLNDFFLQMTSLKASHIALPASPEASLHAMFPVNVPTTMHHSPAMTQTSDPQLCKRPLSSTYFPWTL